MKYRKKPVEIGLSALDHMRVGAESEMAGCMVRMGAPGWAAVIGTPSHWMPLPPPPAKEG